MFSISFLGLFLLKFRFLFDIFKKLATTLINYLRYFYSFVTIVDCSLYSNFYHS